MNRSLIYLLGTALLLVVLVLVFANPFQDPVRKDRQEKTELFDNSLMAGADRIEIATLGGDPVVLSLENEVWLVASAGGFPADTTAVHSLVRALQDARSSGVASKNPKNQGKFQVDDTGARVTVSAGTTPVVSLVVGKPGQDFTTSYVRVADGEEVHVVRGLNRQLFARPQGFRDRVLLQFDSDMVSEVVAVIPDGGWTLSRGDTAWTVAAPGGEAVAASVEEAERLVQSLGTLTADGFFDGSPDTVDVGLENPGYEFVCRFLNGSEARIQVGNTNAQNQRFAARPDRNAIYLLGEWRLNNLAKKVDDLKAGESGG